MYYIKPTERDYALFLMNKKLLCISLDMTIDQSIDWMNTYQPNTRYQVYFSLCMARKLIKKVQNKEMYCFESLTDLTLLYEK